MRASRASAGNKSGKNSLPNVGAPIEVRRHPSARRMTLRVSRTRRAVIVTVPVQCDLDEASTFINRNIDWVLERLGKLPLREPICDGGSVPLRGVLHRIVFLGHDGCRDYAASRTVELIDADSQAPTLHVAGRVEHAERRLKDWMFEEARRDLDVAVRLHAAALGLRPRRIAVRDQTSRWGSCSTTGVLSFSWRLVMAPPRILDYVAAHEVAHLAEMNHGPRFWALVKKTMPGMEEAKRWLVTNGMELHRYGPART